MLLSGACLQASKNSNFPIWTTAWIPTIPSFKPSPRFPNNHIQPSLYISNLIHHGTLEWNTIAINSIFDEASAKEISKIHISTDSKLHYIWNPSCSGRFSTNSAYLSIIAANSAGPASPISTSYWKAIWKLNLTDRLRLFLWKIVGTYSQPKLI